MSADSLQIDLAREQAFRLGQLAVAPALREIAAPDGTRQILEPRVMQVLVALNRAEGAIVSRDELIRTCWNGTVVGEGSINRTISLLRKVSIGIGNGTFRIETVSKVGYRLVLSGSDQPGTPTEGGAGPVRRTVSMRLIAWAALALLVAACGAAALLLRPTSDGPAYSIQVDPFRISGDAGSFDEELLSALASQGVPLAGGENRLTLTGSVDERGGSIRVNARLTEPDRREVVWSGTITRPAAAPGGVAAVAAVVGSIAQCTLAGFNDGGDISADLLASYARTCELGSRGQSLQGLRAARELTRRAPDFAPGWFARSYHANTVFASQPAEDPALRAEALAAAEKLIALRPDAQDGYAAKFLAMERRPTAERERLLLRAMRLDPLYADVAQLYYGRFLTQAGRLEEAFQLRWQDAQQRPEDAFAQGALFDAAAATSRWRIADNSLARLRQLDPGLAAAAEWRRAVWAGNWAQAEKIVLIRHPGQQKAATATYRALASGSPADKQAAIALIEALPADCCLHLRIELLTQLGRHAEAIALIDGFGTAKTQEARDGLQFLWDPALRPLWYEEAFARFLRRNGWIDYWNEAKAAPDVCGEAEAPGFCGMLDRGV